MRFEARVRFAGSWPRIARRFGVRLLVAIVLVATFVAHDGLMIGLAATRGAPTGLAADHAAPHAPTDGSHPDDCWTSQAAAPAARAVTALDLVMVASPIEWPAVAAEASAAARTGALPLLRRGPPRAFLQIWRV